MKGVCSGEEVQPREAQPEAVESYKQNSILKWGQICGTKGENNRVHGCSGRNLGHTKLVKEGVEVGGCHPFIFSLSFLAYCLPLLLPS